MVEQRKPDVLKQIVCGVVILLIAGWISYVSLKGITLDAAAAGLSTKVAVLESVTLTIKEDITEIKTLIKEVRTDQKRRELKEKK
jgi:hypothetical protein